ncbi:ribosome maturation factor RimM [Asticcacaulis sp. BYS171W]|uniref:Ribosome maturation factor RimM n=1 Tax=Asticcacaulis aquaticus TaxID=2984212 RepID=A0ABT5HZ39_9CAUL|nr:ribosome maturation factor RimM [Asticcacaulis aquaticus]MDC7685293.1 ribosome maturation factor RimM [Asticcacaulis aquaticus]
MTQKSNLIFVAQVGAVHGVQGEFKLLSFMDDPVSVLEYNPLLSQDGKPALVITAARAHKGQLLVRAEQAPDRTAAEKLKGLKLYVDRAELPEIEDEDDYYITDLIGLEVRGTDGSVLGRVKAVEDFGAGDLLDIQPKGGASYYLMFTRENVPDVNIADGYVVISPPAEQVVEGEAK